MRKQDKTYICIRKCIGKRLHLWFSLWFSYHKYSQIMFLYQLALIYPWSTESTSFHDFVGLYLKVTKMKGWPQETWRGSRIQTNHWMLPTLTTSFMMVAVADSLRKTKTGQKLQAEKFGHCMWHSLLTCIIVGKCLRSSWETLSAGSAGSRRHGAWTDFCESCGTRS